MTGTILIKDINLHYSVTGGGRDVILLHGWGCDLKIFDSVVAFLKSDFRVFVVDFPGFGRSDVPPTIWGIDDYTSLIEEFTAKLGINEPILMGHSFGGRVSILYASRNITRKVILVDAAGIKPTRTLKYYYKVYKFKLLKYILPLVVGRKKAGEKIEQRRRTAGSADYNALSGNLRDIFVKIVGEDLCSEMPKIKAPVLLIWGENDTATPLKDAYKMERLIPDAGLVIFKNAGHYSFLDKPYDFKAVVCSFLNSDKQ